MHTKVLDSVALIELDISLWEGRKKLRPEDLQTTSGDLPPAEVASLGSKKVIHPDVINQFNRIKQRVKRQLLDRIGTRFLGGWAVPISCLDEAMQEIERERAAFDQARQSFLDHYDDRIEEWVMSHPEWATVIRNAVPSKDEPARQLQFEYSVIKVAPVTDQSGDSVHDRVNHEAEKLGSRTLEEVAEQAQEIWSRIEGSNRVTQNSIKGLLRLIDKLRGWSMIEPRAYHLVEEADQTLVFLPKTGPIEGAALSSLRGLVLLLAEPNRAQGHMQSAQAQQNDSGGTDDWPSQPAATGSTPDDDPATTHAVVADDQPDSVETDDGGDPDATQSLLDPSDAMEPVGTTASPAAEPSSVAAPDWIY